VDEDNTNMNVKRNLVVDCVLDLRGSIQVRVVRFSNYCNELTDSLKTFKVREWLNHGSSTRGPAGCIMRSADTFINCVCTMKITQ
jgi:hypothetical protein